MRKNALLILAVLCLLVSGGPAAHATNGDLLIGIGPNSRAMGGVGVASPTDAISSVFSNPASMCFGTFCPASQFDFAGTLFMPKVDASITTPTSTVKADSEDTIYAIPAIGFSIPIGDEPDTPWRFGLAAYGVSGLGVDYRDTALDNPGFYNFGGGMAAPAMAGEYTQLSIMKFAPSLAYRISSQWSVGLAAHIDYGMLDLRSGTSSGFSFGLQPGIIYKPNLNWSLGLTYISPQEVDHKNVLDFDQDGISDDLKLEAPQQLAFGVGYDFLGSDLLIEGNVRWINWSSPASAALSSADLRRVSSRAFLAASRARFAVKHLLNISLAIAGFSSKNAFSSCASAPSTSGRISLFPSFVLVCPSNCGSVSFTLIIAVNPSRMSSPEKFASLSLMMLNRLA